MKVKGNGFGSLGEVLEGWFNDGIRVQLLLSEVARLNPNSVFMG